jgi:hypothetical protein
VYRLGYGCRPAGTSRLQIDAIADPERLLRLDLAVLDDRGQQSRRIGAVP